MRLGASLSKLPALNDPSDRLRVLVDLDGLLAGAIILPRDLSADGVDGYIVPLLGSFLTDVPKVLGLVGIDGLVTPSAGREED